MKAGRGDASSPLRGGPDLTAPEAERLMTRGMLRAPLYKGALPNRRSDQVPYTGLADVRAPRLAGEAVGRSDRGYATSPLGSIPRAWEFYPMRDGDTWGSAMTSDDLRRKNASLHDRIKQVLEMHPELCDGTEAIALSQDLHVEVGAPFLERTRDKLQERASSITEQRPELQHCFDDLLAPSEGVLGDDPRETKRLTAALAANVALRVEAERLIAAYIEPNSDRLAVIKELIILFNGPRQREAQRLAAGALDKAGERDSWHVI
jgi:hypothetical protein